MLAAMSLDGRFWSKVHMTSECWTWTGATNGSGYGKIWMTEARGTRLAHRVAYAEMVAPVPEGMTLDHLCKNTRCVRPDHLEPVTQAENVRRGDSPFARNARRDTCPKGHELSSGTRRRGVTRRYCKTCARDRATARRQRTTSV